MKHGYIKVAAVTPDILVADCIYNTQAICTRMEEAYEAGAKIIVFPELCLTGYTCSDLFWQEEMLTAAMNGLLTVREKTRGKKALVFVGLPMEKNGKLYNVAAALSDGKILGIVPKRYLPNYAEFYELRHFTPGPFEVSMHQIDGELVPFGMNQLFVCQEMDGLMVAAEICEDLWVMNPPSVAHAMAGATVIVNLSASNENTGKNIYREALVRNQSARLVCGYIYCSAGEGESTTDLVFSGHNLIMENGSLISESERFKNETIYGELDIHKLRSERRRITTYVPENEEAYCKVKFHVDEAETQLSRFIDPSPFVPSGKEDRDKRCEEILTIQALGLKKRIMHTHCRSLVIGISGGLDSTLALLVMAKAADMAGIPRSSILSVTMPCFGTTNRTYQNACELTKKIGATLKEINIKDAVNVHFRDIEQNPSDLDVTFENSQARERTQILMDLANKSGGMVVGTGDLSELALGWATYNGDHMSMYGVNASVPKTLVRHLVNYYAQTCEDAELKKVLLDVLDTPVSPELLPPSEGEISQKTEDLVGPYELHDFFLYHMMRYGEAPGKVYRLARAAFKERYEDEVILKWLKIFYRRFFSQQFKRSCLPDGPKVGSVAVSPRGDLRMPSDASLSIWQRELEKL